VAPCNPEFQNVGSTYIQFIFYQFYQACLWQIASGIYHKLNIIRPNEKITAGQYLQKLDNEELDEYLWFLVVLEIVNSFGVSHIVISNI